MALTKITSVDTANKGVVGLPDTPGLGVLEMQAKFDELATDVIIPKFNNLIDELEATTAAGNIGATSTTHASGTTVQGVLDAMDTYFENKAETDYQTLEEKIDGNYETLDGKIDGVISDLSDLTTRVGAAEDDIGDLNTEVSYLSDRVDINHASWVQLRLELNGFKTRTEAALSELDTKIDNQRNDLQNEINTLSYTLGSRISDVASTANTALSNSQSAVATAESAEQTAESAEHEALTALQGLQAIMSLLQLLLGHIYMNDENGDRIVTESGDRVIVDY